MGTGHDSKLEGKSRRKERKHDNRVNNFTSFAFLTANARDAEGGAWQSALSPDTITNKLHKCTVRALDS